MTILKPGQSGYFSEPVNVLDPHLFDSNEHLKPDVRTRLNNLLLDYLGSRYANPHSWTMVWVAGSGVSYQWSAARGNGDLDVLFGIDYNQFVIDNPDFKYDSREEITEYIDNDLKTNLWPRTAYEMFTYPTGGPLDPYSAQVYEITFFLNNYVEDNPDSIINIHPYAAYNITRDEWTVRPPKKAAHINDLFEEQVRANNETGKALSDRYNSIRQQLSTTALESPQTVNLSRHAAHIKEQARQLFDSIHLGREAAFSSQGEGYSDFYNYQWQAAKRDGLINSLNEIINGE